MQLYVDIYSQSHYFTQHVSGVMIPVRISPRRQEATVPLRDMTYTSGSKYSF